MMLNRFKKSFCVFRVDSSNKIGGGHVFRCITLACELQKSDVDILFICQDLVGNLSNFIIKSGFPVKLISLEQSENDEINDAIISKKIIINYLKNKTYQYTYLIVDHYELNATYEKQLSPLFNHITVIDDLASRRHFCQLLIDQSIGRVPEHYHRLIESPACEILAGAKYGLLREQFHKLRPKTIIKRNSTTEIKNVLISLGATDPHNVTSTIIALLEHSILAKKLQYTVVLTSNAPYLSEVKRVIEHSTLQVDLLIDANNMANLISHADIAIAAAGSSLLERSCLGLPSFVIKLADNQSFIFEMIQKKQLAIDTFNVDELGYKFIPSLEDFILSFNQNPNIYAEIAKKISQLCDGLGAKKVVEQLSRIQFLKPKNVSLNINNIIRDYE
jgi:UDP-2,4-diacetamido-2,4,6-trideoxy-beta-L-altropyranose hydrolase